MARLQALLLLVGYSLACTSDEDCSLLGKCVGGACACNKGWRGTGCSVADLAPLDLELGYQNASQASWGGRPVFDKSSGRWQLVATEILNHCPLILFMYNSQIIRAVAEAGADAGGPYRKADVLFPPFHHNPTIVGPTPDGYFLSFFIGADDASNIIDCREKIPDVPLHPNPKSNGYITMAWTKDLVQGPWQQRVILKDNGPQDNQSSWHCIQNNPTAEILANGTIVLAFRADSCVGHGELLGVAIAKHFSADFVRHPEPIVAPDLHITTSNNEDPFLFALPDGSWHIVNHQQSKGNVCGDSTAGHSCGAHFFARDPRGPWQMSQEAVYSANVTLKNGSHALFQTRQRPQLVFDDDHAPTYLFTSGSFEGNNPDLKMLTHTYAHQFTHATARAREA